MSESNLLELPFAAPPPPEQGRVVVSDAFELLRSLAPDSVDLVVTDPPYESLQIHRARGTTTRLTTNWFSTVSNDRLPDLLREVHRVLRLDRHFYLFCDEVTADSWISIVIGCRGLISRSPESPSIKCGSASSLGCVLTKM